MLLAALGPTLVSRHFGVAAQHSLSDNTLCSALMIQAWGNDVFVPMAYTLRRVRTRSIVALAATLWMAPDGLRAVASRRLPRHRHD